MQGRTQDTAVLCIPQSAPLALFAYALVRMLVHLRVCFFFYLPSVAKYQDLMIQTHSLLLLTALALFCS